jgi:hypothetical protein
MLSRTGTNASDRLLNHVLRIPDAQLPGDQLRKQGVAQSCKGPILSLVNRTEFYVRPDKGRELMHAAAIRQSNAKLSDAISRQPTRTMSCMVYKLKDLRSADPHGEKQRCRIDTIGWDKSFAILTERDLALCQPDPEFRIQARASDNKYNSTLRRHSRTVRCS